MVATRAVSALSDVQIIKPLFTQAPLVQRKEWMATNYQIEVQFLYGVPIIIKARTANIQVYHHLGI